MAPYSREDSLLAYPWPGNVRELASVRGRVALLSEVRVASADLLDETNWTISRTATGRRSAGRRDR